MFFVRKSDLKKALCVVGLFLNGCQSLGESALNIAEVMGSDSLVKATSDLTPLQEYYLGRSILARVITANPPVKRDDLQNYINHLGQYLALHSTRPKIYAGYRFVVTEDATLSATSAPGGFVVISKSMLNIARNEDELAAVLAHEISHIALKHAEENIKNRNRLEVGRKIFEGLTSTIPSSQQLASFSEAISIGVDAKFNQNQEYEADEAALRILQSAGYSPVSLYQVINRIPDSSTFFGSHPRNESRNKLILNLTRGMRSASSVAARARFLKYTR
jgi:predicted Zn-dependent protease